MALSCTPSSTHIGILRTKAVRYPSEELAWWALELITGKLLIILGKEMLAGRLCKRKRLSFIETTNAKRNNQMILAQIHHVQLKHALLWFMLLLSEMLHINGVDGANKRLQTNKAHAHLRFSTNVETASRSYAVDACKKWILKCEKKWFFLWKTN